MNKFSGITITTTELPESFGFKGSSNELRLRRPAFRFTTKIKNIPHSWSNFFFFSLKWDALWSGTNKNRDVSTGPLARPFARSLALLTRLLAPDCSLRSRPSLHSLVRSVAHFAHSLAGGKVNY